MISLSFSSDHANGFHFSKVLALLFASLFVVTTWSQGVGINETGASPDASAILDASSTNKGFLPPRMTHAQKNAISSPAAGLVLWCSDCGASGELQVFNGTEWTNMVGDAATEPLYPSGYVHCNPSNPTAVVDVINPSTGKTWMDRNLGANRAATSSTDSEAYGSLFQWGRGADGHQCVNRYAGDGVSTAEFTSSNATTAEMNAGNIWDGLFIIVSSSPYNWLATADNNLWQGLDGVNNPCPSGYRLPTSTELNNERLSWIPNNAAGGFGSPLKFAVAGRRSRISGSVINVSGGGYYWSSSVDGINATNISYSSTIGSQNSQNRSYGFSVRCIKD